MSAAQARCPAEERIMRPVALFSLSGSETIAAVAPGELIGRSDLAALCIDDPRVSEAHAMVSLRSEGLMLLALRGRFRMQNKVYTELCLEPGLEVELADGLTLRCEEVVLPLQLTALKIPGLPMLTLTRTMTLFMQEQSAPRIAQGYHAGGDAIFWAVGEQWRARTRESEAPQSLQFGQRVRIGALDIEVVPIALRDAARGQTRAADLAQPLSLQSLGEAVRVTRDRQPPAIISGVPGKICAALVEGGRAMSWRQLTQRVWPDDASLESALRRRFDAGISRLRERLQQLGVDDGIIRLDGAGFVILTLEPEDASDEAPESSELPDVQHTP